MAQPKSYRSSIVTLLAMMFVRLGAMLVVFKFLSTSFGPERFGTISQVMAISAIFYMFAGGGLTNGLIRHVAADESDAVRREWLSSATWICFASSLLLGAVAIFLYGIGGGGLLPSAEMATLFLVIGTAQIIVGAGNIALAYLSGVGDLKSFSFANALGNIFALVVVVVSTLLAGFPGGLVSAAIMPLLPAVLGIIAIIAGLRADVIPLPKLDREKFVTLLKFSGTMLVAITAVPFAQLYIRADFAGYSGWETVGYWQATVRLSDAYMQIFGVLFVNLLLPQLAGHQGQARIKVLKTLGAALVGLFLFGGVLYYLMRDIVIQLAFSSQFLPSSSYVGPQLLGDLCKVLSGIIIYYFVASGTLWVHSFAEVVQAIFTMLFYIVLKSIAGVHAPVYGHALACALLLIVMATLFFYKTSNMGRRL